MAATPEITLSPAIQTKAADLNHDPVAIYHWVRNNVEWLPTWGAMQDADLTLDTLKGNAMDIASLTIALLRASGIPARYAHGTIDVPVEKFMNWAGGFTDPTAAGDHASAGGIPIVAVTAAGKISSYRLEHIWVEAAIDYFPSRGLVNRDADAWIDLDPSFKQYNITPGIDMNVAAPFDAAAFAQQFEATLTVDPVTGGVSGGDPALIQNAITQRKNALDLYLAITHPNATVRDVIGGKTILPEGVPALPSSQPYGVVAQGATYGHLPGSLEFNLSFQFQQTDPFGFPLADTVPLTLPFAQVNNQKVTVGFRPATAADEQVLQALLPAGAITDVAQLPTSIPAYLIKVIPELRVNGQIVMEGPAAQMGSDQLIKYTIAYPNGMTQGYSSNIEAGTYHSVGVFGGGVSKNQAQGLQGRVSQLQTELQAGNTTNADREAILGDLFYAGTLGYFAMYRAMSALQAQQAQMRHDLMPSVGTYGLGATVSRYFGIPRTMSMSGIIMDIGNLATLSTDLAGVKQARLNFVMSAGMLSSALEHVVPEQMFSTPTAPVSAISAVKALQIAAQQGIPVHHIDATNAATVVPLLNIDALALEEIQAAIAVGKEVTVSQSNITEAGWTGVGYIITDPVTGSGAYKISTGKNGSWIYLVGAIFFGAIACMFLLTFGMAAILGIVWAASVMAMLLNKHMQENPNVKFSLGAFFFGVSMALFLVPRIAALFGLGIALKIGQGMAEAQVIANFNNKMDFISFINVVLDALINGI